MVTVALEEESVRLAVEAFLNDKALPENSPLWYLLCMQPAQPYRSTVVGRAATETQIIDRFHQMIRRLLDHQRALHGLSPANPRAVKAQVLAELRKDFAYDSKALQSASYLYHRVARSDLDLSVDELE
jgi:hypothetical protein